MPLPGERRQLWARRSNLKPPRIASASPDISLPIALFHLFHVLQSAASLAPTAAAPSPAKRTMAAVNRNMFDASISADSRPHARGPTLMALPLNLIAHIISYVRVSCRPLLSRTADAALCRRLPKLCSLTTGVLTISAAGQCCRPCPRMSHLSRPQLHGPSPALQEPHPHILRQNTLPR